MRQVFSLQGLCTLLFGIAVLLFFGLVYPHHLHYQEQFQLFLFEGGYVWDIVRQPGGVADLLGRFCTQFFLYAWAGATIIALLLMAVQLLTLRLVRWGRLYALSFVPAGLLWLFLLDENALLGGVWAVLLILLAAWVIQKAGNGKVRWILIAVLLPLLYWMVCKNGFSHYRLPGETPTPLWLAVVSLLLLPQVIRLCRRWAEKAVTPLWTLLTFLVVAAGFGGGLYQRCNLMAEQVMGYDFMARHQTWNRILTAVKADRPNHQIGVTAQNLALAMRGQLSEHAFEYNQNGLAGLLPPFERDPMSPLVTGEAFYQLGMINTAQRFAFEAQEAIPDFQKSARCYKRLAQTNLIVGNYAVARKYLTALQKTLFYRDWATETLPLLGNETAINAHPEYGRLRLLAYHEDFYFSDRETPQMLGRLLMSNPQNRLAFEYLEAAYLLTGNLDGFVSCVDMGQSLGYNTVPKHFQEALILWWSHSHGPNEQMPMQLNPAIIQGMNRFYGVSNTPGMTNEVLARQFGNTYWYYFFTTLQR